jgi:hypothetical protein
MEAVTLYETSFKTYHTTKWNILEDSHPYICRSENLKPQPLNIYGEATLRYVRRC